MKNRILSYRNRIDDLLAHPEQISDLNAVIEEHLVQISFFQHERLVHLIVTVTVAILTLMSAGIFIATSCDHAFYTVYGAAGSLYYALVYA